LEWPTPMRMTTSAGADYGYQGTTILLSSVQIPATAQPGTIIVGGELRWLVCHDVCLPLSTFLKAPIQIASSTNINEAALRSLKSASERLPKPLPASYQAEAASSKDGFRLTMLTGVPITHAEFYPSEEGQIDNGAAQELAAHADRVSLTLKKSEYLRQVPQHLQGVIILNGTDAYLIDLPIHAMPAQRRSRQR